MVDKNKAIIEFLMTYPNIANTPLYFNAINASNNTRQIVTQGNETSLNRKYIDGSELKRYVFTLVDYRSVAYQPIVTDLSYPIENVDELREVQELLNWVEEQNENHNFPDFGENYEIDSMHVLSNNPNLNGIDTSIKPALAKYSIAIQIEYLDLTHALWK